MPQEAGHVAPQQDADGVRHTLSVKEVEAQLVAAGVPRSHRHIVRLCKSGAFDAAKRPGGSGDEWFTAPQSIPKVIGDLRAIQDARTRHGAPHRATSDLVAAKISSRYEPDPARHDAPEHPMALTKDGEHPNVTERATSRYVELLENDNKFLRDQVGRKDEQITDLSKRFGETQTLLGAMQRMLAPLLGQPDPFKKLPENREEPAS
jgi:hypothetical protein